MELKSIVYYDCLTPPIPQHTGKLGYFIPFSFFRLATAGLYLFEKGFDLFDDSIYVLFGCALFDRLRYLLKPIAVPSESLSTQFVPEISGLTNEFPFFSITTICFVARWTNGSIRSPILCRKTDGLLFDKLHPTVLRLASIRVIRGYRRVWTDPGRLQA